MAHRILASPPRSRAPSCIHDRLISISSHTLAVLVCILILRPSTVLSSAPSPPITSPVLCAPSAPPPPTRPATEPRLPQPVAQGHGPAGGACAGGPGLPRGPEHQCYRLCCVDAPLSLPSRASTSPPAAPCRPTTLEPLSASSRLADLATHRHRTNLLLVKLVASLA